MGEVAFRVAQFVKRPDTGGVGDQIRVRTNFFEVTRFQDMNISQYDVIISPTVPRRLNLRVFNRFVEQYRESALGGARPVFDGKAIMFVHKPLPFEANSFDVTLEEDNAPVASRRPPRQFRVRIRKARDIVLGELFQYLEARGRMTEDCHMAIMAMDIIISHKVATRYPTVRRSFYTPQVTKRLSGGLEAWQGYYQSARPTWRGKMMININLTATAFYQSGSLVNLIAEILGLRSPNDLSRQLSENHDKVEDTIKGLKITDNHRTGNRRKFKIEGLTPTSASRTMFDRGDGSNIDVRTYFQNTYNRPLQYPFLPCVIVSVRRKTYLPLEVCDVIPEQRCIRKLNKDQIDEIMGFSRQNPISRANKIREGLNVLNYRGNEYLQQFGMSISNEMAEVNARILPTPAIMYKSQAPIRPKDGVWNLRDKKLATGATLGSWSVVAFLNEDKWPDHVINNFIRELIITCQDTGMDIPNKRPPLLRVNHQGNIEESLKQAWLKAGNAAKANPQLILAILPNTGPGLYAEIKRVSDTIIGVATQCIQSAHIRRPNKQYCANVCLKINVKLGGMNSYLIRDDISFVAEEPTILMGADVSHPPPGDQGSRSSFAALCASIDAKASRYTATIRAQTERYEIIVDLGNMVKELLKTFYQTCGRKPQRILFYRDGVSESQFVHVLQSEIDAIRGACQALDVRYRPTITFVVVQKRHNTRFFPMERRYTDRSGNCLPGTVVDTDITHPFEFDFYLQSHAGLLGTSRPAHYHVLFDENGFNADSLQTLSYNLCYIYVRCTRAVSLVPPVYYAHLVTNRARIHSHTDPTTFGVVKENLQRVMYFA